MEKFLPYVTAIIAILGFVFSVWKYIDLKNREEKRLNYENYSKIIQNLKGELNHNTEMVFLEGSFYVANVYKLLEFPEYKYISIPLLNLKKETLSVENEKQLKHIEMAIDDVLKKLTLLKK